ncbi:transmembrane reductase CYB561D2-like [Topomyia yanbarensis]|uniref:transmembrane reductase CYB561D2-like n=1 Tax=Topomyia yanbarensis TaxID=2498891 RepID=UPI00273B4A4B|nr:transmembrane reductase CYB561D2-like [Topomyia yanbarensis]
MENLAVDSKNADSKKAKSVCLETAQLLLNTINHIFIGFVFIYTAWICWKNGFEKVFTWHVILCVFGFHVLMAEAILLFYSRNSWSQVLRQPERRTAHWVLQVIGSVCIVVGIALEFYWRDINNKPHFHETHSILGLVALILLIVSMSNGIGALYATELRKRVKPIYLKFGHNLIGLACFVIGMASLMFGYKKRIFKENSSPEILTAIQIFTILVIFLSVFGALKTIVTQIKAIIR